MRRLAIVLSATALAVALPGPAAGQAAPSSEEYVPFVTDFPKPAAAPVPAADPTLSPVSKAGAGGTDWRDAGVGFALGAGLVALLAGSRLVLAHRTGPART